jgi:MtN3 and saliva related transmembrane protein
MVIEIISYLGVIGLILIALGWIPQTLETIKKKKNNLNLKFNLLYTIGSLLLTVYAITLSDTIFIILNGFAFLMSGIGLYYNIRK